MKQLTQYFINRHIETVLDIGTGKGEFIHVLKEVFPMAKITGIDPVSESIIEARQKYLDVVFCKMGAEEINYNDNSFDVASISMALHHLMDAEQALSEMKRVVRTGGWIIVNELFSDNLNEAQKVHRLYHHFRSKTDRILGISHNETFKKDEIIELIRSSGIRIKYSYEYIEEENLITSPEQVEEYAGKMIEMLENVKEYPEYITLKPRIDEFREKALKYGFQPATRIVIVGEV